MLGINKQDIEFLKELQHELNTQDHVSQASPRFWVVAGTVKEYGYDVGYADGSCLRVDCETVLESMEEAYDYILDGFPNFPCEYDTEHDIINYMVEDEEEWYVLHDMDDLKNFLEEQGEDDIEVVSYKEVHKIFESTMFLTNRDCKEHIRLNHNHYPSDAHSYAMTAWRTQEVTRVWNMLEKINWDEISKLIGGNYDEFFK